MLTGQRTIFQKESVEALRDQLNIDYDEIVQKHEKVAGQGVPRIPR